MDGNVDFPLEDAVVRLEGDALHGELTELVQHIGDGIEHTVAVDALDADTGVEEEHLVRVPTRGDDTVAIARLELRAYLAAAGMNFEHALRIDVAHHVIAGEGVTARGNGTFAEYLLVEHQHLLAIERCGESGVGTGCGALILLADKRDELAPSAAASLTSQAVGVLVGQGERSCAQSTEEFLALGKAPETGKAFHQGNGVLNFLRGKELPEGFLAPLLLLAVFAAQDGLYFALGLGGGGKGEPFGLHMLGARGNNLDLVATTKPVGQRDELVVDLGAEAVAAKEGVDGECKVESGGAGGHRLEVALGGEYEYLGGEEVELDGVEQVKGVGLRVVQDFLDGVEPFIQLVFVVGRIGVFVFPMCCKALFSYVVHTVGTYLHFYPFALLAHEGIVERLIAVGLGITQPVAETFGVRGVDLCEGRINPVALVNFVLAV